MLIWWVLSLIILIACGIFTYRMIVSSYEFLPADKRFLFRFRKQGEPPIFSDMPDSIKVLRSKLQHVEDNNTFYHIQFTRFQDRLKTIEDKVDRKLPKEGAVYQQDVMDEESDWKELYYEENEKKEALENELDVVKQELDDIKEKLYRYETEHEELIKIKSDYDLRMNDLQSMQNNIMTLQGKLDASAEREKELEQVLLSEITIREKYSLLKKDYAKLKCEVDDLKTVIGSKKFNKKH